MSQERLMVLFVVFFFAGTLLMIYLPQDGVLRGIVMTVYSLLVFGAVFRFGL